MGSRLSLPLRTMNNTEQSNHTIAMCTKFYAKIFCNQDSLYKIGQMAKTELLVGSMPGPGHKNGALPDRHSSRALEVVFSCRPCWNDESLFHVGQYSDRTSHLRFLRFRFRTSPRRSVQRFRLRTLTHGEVSSRFGFCRSRE